MTEDVHIEPIDGTFSDLGDAEVIPPVWVIKDLLPAGITFIAGPPKQARKSSLEMAMAVLVAGVECEALPSNMRQVVHGGTVMGLSAEATAGELRHMIEKGMGVKVPADRRILIADNPWEFRLDDGDALNRMLGWLNDRKPRMFFIDPLRDFHALDERDDGGMNRLLRPIQRWAKENDSAFVVVHHTKKKGKDEGDYDALDMRGTTALFGIADAVLMITPRGNEVLHIGSTFKRGQSWERDIRLGMWGRKAEGGVESIEPVAGEVFKALAAGAQDMAAVAKQLTRSKSTVIEAVQSLTRIGAVVKNGRTYKPVKGGDVLVAQALKHRVMP